MRFSPAWAARCAGLVHDLHRWRLPFTRRVLLPLNVVVIESHLRAVHAAFTAHQAPFWLRDGTALGAWREGGVIAHDDDIDLGVWAADETRWSAAVAELEAGGFVVYRRTPTQVALFKDWETIEICVSGREPPADAYTQVLEDFFRVRRPLRFLGLEFEVPAEIEGYLEFSYGADWRVPKFGAWWSNSWWQAAAVRDAHARTFGLLARRGASPNAAAAAAPPKTGIPRRVFQSWRSLESVPESCRAHVAAWREQCARLGWSWEFHDDEAVDQRLTEAWPERREALAKLSTIERMDLWRYLIVYQHGGIYADIDCQPQPGLERLAWSLSEPVVQAEYATWLLPGRRPQLAQFFFAFPRGSSLLAHVIEVAWQGLETRPHRAHGHWGEVLATTGPGAFTATLIPDWRKLRIFPANALVRHEAMGSWLDRSAKKKNETDGDPRAAG